MPLFYRDYLNINTRQYCSRLVTKRATHNVIPIVQVNLGRQNKRGQWIIHRPTRRQRLGAKIQSVHLTLLASQKLVRASSGTVLPAVGSSVCLSAAEHGWVCVNVRYKFHLWVAHWFDSSSRSSKTKQTSENRRNGRHCTIVVVFVLSCGDGWKKRSVLDINNVTFFVEGEKCVVVLLLLPIRIAMVMTTIATTCTLVVNIPEHFHNFGI